MTVARTAAEVLEGHVTLEVESIDRMYLNLYVPQLQRELGVVGFFKQRGFTFASGALMQPITDAFVGAIKTFVDDYGVDLVRFTAGERKDDIAQAYLEASDGAEQVLFVGVAQEKARVWTTEKRRNPDTGATYPWLVRSTRVINHYYFYGIDDDFGLFFVKLCSYFPYNGKVLINGHHFAQRQAAKAGIGFDTLDNGFATCDDPDALQGVCDRLDDATINRSCASGSRSSRTPTRPRTARPGSATTCRSCSPSSRSPRCWTGRCRGGCCSRTSSATTSTWAGPTWSGWSSTGGWSPAGRVRPRAGSVPG